MPIGPHRLAQSRDRARVATILILAVSFLGTAATSTAGTRLRPQQPEVPSRRVAEQQKSEVSAPPLDGATLQSSPYVKQDDGDAAPLLKGRELTIAPLAELAPAFAAEAVRVAEIATWNREHPELLKEGFTRPLAESRAVSLDESTINAAKIREDVSGGRLAESGTGSVVWTASVRVGEAHRFRLHLSGVELPKGARIWVYGADGIARGPVGREGISPERELWCPSVSGDTVWIEVHVPANKLAAGERCAFVVDSVVEIFRVDNTGAPVAPKSGAGSQNVVRDDSCITDISCFSNSTTVNNASRAIGRMGFVSGGESYVCTGGLINGQAADGTPYFLTANHCLATQSEVSSLEVLFDYRTSSCNGTAPSNPPSSHGGTLLATSEASDFTFIRLASVPANRWFMGWTTSSPGSATLERVSNPYGDTQVYSSTRGVTPDGTCGGLPNSSFLYQDRIQGGVAGGSSGSPVWMGNTVVVGQLYGACGDDPDNNCDSRQNVVDGRFATTFPAISQYLQGGGGGTLAGTPTSLVATVNGSRVDLDWIDNTTVDVVFKVERRTSGGSFEVIGTTALNVSSYSDNTAVPGVSYVYRVRALATPGGQYTAYSNEATVGTQANGPSAPANLYASRIKRRKVTIEWTDTSNNESNFEVLEFNGSSFVSLGYVSANSGGALITGLSRQTTYRFAVRSCNGNGCSAMVETTVTTR